MHLFFTPELHLGTYTLPEEEAHHALHVLRLKVGERIGLLDGKGVRAEAEITAIDKKECQVRVVRSTQDPPERPGRIHLAIAPTKQNERFEWCVEKCTEIGVDRITPLLTSRTERTRLRKDRSQRVAIAAMKQSQRSWLPAIDDPMPMVALLQEDLPTQRYFGWCEGDHRSLAAIRTPGDVLLLIGPEGDFTPDEADLLRSMGFVAVSLGPARLRTETAAMVGCTLLNAG
ncbi:MAG: 16S rRNA (uracil(1498)-N(3))-methyltransferase [Flavobacteriales bacterium]|nr:16S rRNA (uracil(1498)-N(3))-methyltransferase [Flavobacteriales bacterium]MCB9194137.1 16S rRNA (uracil(1498)-N(3))-methyltransferase [Flavobacteriales bacterium]